MPTTINPSEINNILLTRPAPKGQALADTLAQHGFVSLVQPLFNYQARASSEEIKQCLAEYKNALVIFVSVAAVQFAQTGFAIGQWQSKQVFAVGQATKKALQDVGIKQVICPAVQSSEGLLALPQFTDVTRENIIIIRGDGGREYLASRLRQKQAKVCYLETYQRNWFKQEKNIVQQWQAAKINCIVVTSNALLEKLVKLTLYLNIKDNDYWQKQCLWLVVSQRIADTAKSHGLSQVINSNGASGQAILQALDKVQLKNKLSK